MKIRNAHYLTLLVILLTGFSIFLATGGNTPLQVAVGVATSIAYVAWGIVSHALTGELHPKIVIEYILIGGIAIVLIVTIVR